MTRDYVAGFLQGQVASGIVQEDAKANFTKWLQADKVKGLQDPEKAKIFDDLVNYDVK